MNFIFTQHSKSNKTRRNVVTFGVMVKRGVVSMSCCVSGKEGGERGERPLTLCVDEVHRGHLLYVRNKMPVSGFSGITGQCQPI